MFDFMIRVSQLVLPVFIFCTMANIGMTQHPSRIVKYWSDWPFYLKMVVANFAAAPAAMWLLLQLWPLRLDYMAALDVYSLCAGAPFLIKLTAKSEHDLALGAATMMLLVLGTIIIVPLLLPILTPRVSIDGLGMAWTLVKQLLVPMVIGGLVARWLPAINKRIQPWIARVGNIALNIVLVTTLVGYLPTMPELVLSGALAVGLAFVLVAFGIGYVAGWGNDALEDIGGLATAQRNTAAAMLIAISSFSDPIVFVLIALVSTVGIVMLLVIAKLLKGDNARVQPFWPEPE